MKMANKLKQILEEDGSQVATGCWPSESVSIWWAGNETQ